MQKLPESQLACLALLQWKSEPAAEANRRRSQQYRSYPAAEQPEVTSKHMKTPQLHFLYTGGEVGQVGQHSYKTHDMDFVNFYIQQVLQKYLSEHYWLVWGNNRKEGKSSVTKTPLRISQQAETSNNFRILKGIGSIFSKHGQASSALPQHSWDSGFTVLQR